MKLSFVCGTSSLLLLGLYLAISTQPAFGEAETMTDPARVREILQHYRENIESEIKANEKISFGNWRKATQLQSRGTVYEFSDLEIYHTSCKRDEVNVEEKECSKQRIALRSCDVKVIDPTMPGSSQRKVKVIASDGCPTLNGWTPN